MLFTMLFEDSEIEKKEKLEWANKDIVRKGPSYLLVIYPLAALVLIALGVLCLIFQPLRQYVATAICLFAVSIAPLFFFIDLLTFRLTIAGGKILIRKIGAGETAFPYSDITWQMESPDKKKSAVLLFARGLQFARIMPGAPNYELAVSLRHKGTLTADEKKLLQSIKSGK